MQRRGPDKLEIIISFDRWDDITDHIAPTGVTWQWRSSDCAKNGTAETPSQAINHAMAAYRDTKGLT